jgi:hypothetical protein
LISGSLDLIIDSNMYSRHTGVTLATQPVFGGEKMNKNLLDFFILNYGRCRVAIVGSSDLIGEAIRISQRKLTPDGKPSLWSHAFILGEMRPDRRGPGCTTSHSPYIFESDIHINLPQVQIRNGVQENWIGKWCHDDIEHAAILDFDLSKSEQDTVLGTALQLCDEQLQYPLLELLGTWLAIITKHVWMSNPFDDPHAMYCSAFARYCYQQAGQDFMGNEVSLSNTAPEHIAQSRQFQAEWHK